MRTYVPLIGAALVVILAVTVAVFQPHTQAQQLAIENSPAKTIDQKLGTIANTQLSTNPARPAVAVPAAAPLEAAANSALPKGCVLAATLTRAGATYQVGITNKGAASCKNVSYTIYYPKGETFVSSSPRPTASNYYWEVGALKSSQVYAGATITVSGTGDGGELCAATDNGADSCVEVTGPIGAATPAPAQTPKPPSPSAPPVTSAPPPVAVTNEYGIWVWDSAYAMTPARRTQVVQQAKAGGFNTVYITIDDYLTTADADKAAYASALSSFIGEATAAGMSVDAVSGWRDWAKPANRSKGYALIAFADEFNKMHTNKIRSFQYDVEPYLLPEYEANKAAVLGEYVAFIDESMNRLAATDLRFSVVIPHFYDSAQNWTPTITYNGTTAATYTQLLRILDRKPGSDILVMSYRNFTDGTDGAIQLSKVEIAEAQGHPTKVIVSQETGDVEPAYVTFFGMSKLQLAAQVATLRTAFTASTGFGGVAVHYIEPYVALK